GATPRQMKRWIAKGYLWTQQRKIPVEFLSAFVEEHSELIASKKLPEVQLWLRDLLQGHPAETASLSMTEVARKLGVPRDKVSGWVEKGWLVQSGKCVTRAALKRFVGDHPEEIPYQSLPAQRRNWLRALGYGATSKQPETPESSDNTHSVTGSGDQPGRS